MQPREHHQAYKDSRERVAYAGSTAPVDRDRRRGRAKRRVRVAPTLSKCREMSHYRIRREDVTRLRSPATAYRQRTAADDGCGTRGWRAARGCKRIDCDELVKLAPQPAMPQVQQLQLAQISSE